MFVGAHTTLLLRIRCQPLSRNQAALELARSVRQHHRHVVATHANGQANLNPGYSLDRIVPQFEFRRRASR